MADGEGLLAAQQSAAAQIPYRNSQMALQGAETAASSVVNAFFMAQQINSKRQQLENQLMNTQFKMTLDNAKFDNTIKEQAWKHQYELSEEQRRSNSALELSDIRERTAALHETVVGNKLNEVRTGTDDTAAMSDEVSKLRQSHAPGTIEYQTGLQDIIDQHRDAMNTKPGAALVKMYRDENKQATTKQHQDAVEAHQNFQDNLSAFGKSKEFTLDDFRQPDSVWGKTGGNRWIAVDAATKQRLTPQEVQDRNSQGVQFHTLTADQYRVQKKSFDRVDKYLSGDPANLPPVSRQNQVRPAIQHAREAISAGAPKDQVIKRLQDMGEDPSDL